MVLFLLLLTIKLSKTNKISPQKWGLKNFRQNILLNTFN